MVPGERISARVAVRASDLGSSPPISRRHLRGQLLQDRGSLLRRQLGERLLVRRSMSSGGAVRSMYRYRSIAC